MPSKKRKGPVYPRKLPRQVKVRPWDEDMSKAELIECLKERDLAIFTLQCLEATDQLAEAERGSKGGSGPRRTTIDNHAAVIEEYQALRRHVSARNDAKRIFDSGNLEAAHGLELSESGIRRIIDKHLKATKKS